MTAFHTLDIASSSLGVHQTWLDALANNISNANTARSTDENAFQAQYVVARSADGGGVEVASIENGDPDGRLVYDPDNPKADDQGLVRMPAMEMSDQMTDLIMAQRGYQASVQVTKTAQDTYSSALEIGGKA